MNTLTGMKLSFAPEIGATLQEQVAGILSGWTLPDLADDYLVSAMSGGGSNVNLMLEGSRHTLALRVCAPDPGRWGVDRAASIQAQSDAARADLAPKIFASTLPEGHFLCPFLPGGVMTPTRMREEGLLPAVVETLRKLHAQPTSGRDFSPFEDAAHFVKLGDAEGAVRPGEFPGMYERVREIAQLFAEIDAPRAFCHSDLVPQNFIVGDRLRLIDWDYAGVGWIAFEMASFACQAGLTDDETETMLRLYDPEVDDSQRARVALMRAVAGVREAAWATMAEPILSAHTTPLDGWTYQGYASTNLSEARKVWAGAGFAEMLQAAAHVREGALF
ncbi:phosphotransferase [Sphingobium sp. ZW T5_29]|uniref:phosphotransferase n=1 Tax=Sphingobium sp. ZW T5_29 TaxID=3378077 RepID=UPI00385518C5